MRGPFLTPITPLMGSLLHAGPQVDPYDSAALAQAIRRIDGDEGLRADYSVRGRAQAAVYSPENYRQRLKDLYQRFT